MVLCIVSPRFYPVIGGTETYMKNIATYCSKYMNTIVVTSNLKSVIKRFEKQTYLKKRNDTIENSIKIIRSNTLHNKFLRILFYFNEFLAFKFEKFVDKSYNNMSYEFNHERGLGQNERLFNSLMISLVNQKFFINPVFSQIYFILKKIHDFQKIEIIHSSPIYLTSNISAFRFSRKNNIPFICTPTFHINPYEKNIFCPSFQYLLKKTDGIIAETNKEKQFYNKFGIDKNKIYVIPPGINPNDYKKPNVGKFKIKYKIPKDAPLLLFMGRRTYYKGVLSTILSLKYLIKKFQNIKLMIAGPKTKEYSLIFNKLPLELKSHIIDLGVIRNNIKSDVFASCDIFILPSLDDAFGIVYLEAWLFKKPVIGALEGNVADVINDNVNGFLIPFKNIKKLALKIEVLLKNLKLREEFGQNGYDKLNNNYLLEKTNSQVLNLYKKFI